MAFVRFWLNARLQPQAYAYDTHAQAWDDWSRYGGAITEYPEMTASQFNGRSDPPPATSQPPVESRADASPRAGVDGSAGDLGVAMASRPLQGDFR